MPVFLPALLAASHIVLVADEIPKFDVEYECQITAAASVPANRDLNACKRDEATARNKLNEQWGVVHARSTGALRVIRTNGR